MEYAGNETVWDLVRSQNKLVQSADRTSMSVHVRIPEPFCWYMLHRLAEALAVMANPGHIIEDYPDWSDPQVIHHDIKLDNVFLGVPDPNSFPLYPVPKIGDFGSARVTYKDDPDNPNGWRGDFMTLGYIPPEMDSSLRVMEETAREFRTHATNVFQVGAMLRYMMQLQTQEGAQQIRYRHAYDRWEARYQDWKYPMDGCDMYSQDLRDLVARCIDPHHRNRPSPQEILDICNDVGSQHLQGMGDPVGAKLEGNRPFRLRFSMPSDGYKLKMLSMRFQVPTNPDGGPQSTPAAAGAPANGNNNAGRRPASN
ncbi:kinase-like domain-containing protein [Delphinella strobiligena]|nr:kinase-like domain-containing protein [Delphinella strobiligena]